MVFKNHLSIPLIVFLCSCTYAEQTKTVFNPFTGNPDYITALSTTSIGAGSNITVSTTSSGVTISASGGGSGSGIVSPGSFTWTNEFGVLVSTIQVSSNTIIAGATFYQNGPWSISGSIGASGGVLQSGGAGQIPTWAAVNLTNSNSVGGILPSANVGAGGTSGQIQYNNSGTLSGALSYVTSSSMTIQSSMTVTNLAGTTDPSPGVLTVYSGSAPGAGGQPIFTVGSQNQATQFQILDQKPLNLTRYGANLGSLVIGNNGSPQTNEVQSNQSSQQNMNFWNGGEMDIETATTANGGGNMVFSPNQVSEVTISSLAVTISTRTILGSGGYVVLHTSNTILPGTTFYQNGPALYGQNIQFSSTSLYGVVGSTLADNALAGNVGEYVFSSVGSVNITTTNMGQDITSIVLSSGDWNVTGMVNYSIGTATWTEQLLYVSTGESGNSFTSANAFNRMLLLNSSSSTTPAETQIVIANVRVSIAASTTIYLKVKAVFSAGTPVVDTGSITARRVR
jgi:hypothetical protein